MDCIPLLNPDVRGGYAVEMLARAICVAEGLNPDCRHQNYGLADEHKDGVMLVGDKLIPYRLGWRRYEKAARGIATTLVPPSPCGPVADTVNP
jgi:hypothetical protein